MSPIRIKVLIPNFGMDEATLEARRAMLSKFVSSEVEISVEGLEKGPSSIEYFTDEYLAGCSLIKQSIRAEKQGFQAIVIYCFSDVAITAIRENVAVPVIGPGEVSLAVADMISNRFTVITTSKENISRTWRRLRKNTIAKEKMTSVRQLDIHVVDLREDPDNTGKSLYQVCHEAKINEDIDTVILGCLGLAGYGDRVKKELGLKLIDPAFLAISFAEMAVRNDLVPVQLSFSTYPKSFDYEL